MHPCQSYDLLLNVMQESEEQQKRKTSKLYDQLFFK